MKQFPNFLSALAVIICLSKNAYTRRIKTPDFSNELANVQVIFWGEHHFESSYKEEIIASLDTLKELGVDHLAIEIFPAHFQHLLNDYFQNPTQELEEKIYGIIYTNLYFCKFNGERGVRFSDTDELDEFEDNLNFEDPEISNAANSYLQLIKEAMREGIKVEGIGIYYYEDSNITGENYEKFMAAKIRESISEGRKILVLVGMGHIDPKISPPGFRYGYLPQLLVNQGYSISLFKN